MGQLPVIVRTLDAGGDKELPYLNMPAEANPFLGVRAIRLCFQQPDLFRTQLRAILRAGAAGNFRIMFPMIAGLEEVILARQFVEEAHRALAQAGHRAPVAGRDRHHGGNSIRGPAQREPGRGTSIFSASAPTT